MIITFHDQFSSFMDLFMDKVGLNFKINVIHCIQRREKHTIISL